MAIALVLVSTVAVGGLALATAWPTGAKVDQSSPPKADQLTAPHWVNLMRADDLQPNQPVHSFEHKLWLVKLDSGEVLALSHKSTYLGCTVPWRPDFTFGDIQGWFRDPCQGATWDLNGNLVVGPAPRGLDQYAVQIVDGNIEARVGMGAEIRNAPSEALPYRASR